ncbi:hypothetical protein OEZ60_17915 [Defluviimonas sp. WL0024]|uniref:Uncharacterized protein n=1 Tax=Albidovulum salinarum TaxID=2984153 RepID=A0ABT2X933_9RHOB|nr:hypothetical protein [Defluviimonas sp. WL0024]MCU9849879.1 hypothetical protein [Defluviimonas sp. WL0024]
MSNRFDNMVKVAKEPAAKILAGTNTRLQTPLEAPASALPEVVLAELDRKGALVDLLRLMSVLLPPRERVWWACLAARDVVGAAPAGNTPSLLAAEAWVRKPSQDNREAARVAIDHALIHDDTVHCATAALFADGTLGPGSLAQHPAPAGASEVSAFAMNVVALGEHSDRFQEYGQLLVERAVDIARGGNGRVEKLEPDAQEG